MPRPLLLFIVVILMATGFFVSQTLQLPGSDEVSTFIGPRLWPLMVLTVLLAMTLLLAINILLDRRRGNSEPPNAIDTPALSEKMHKQNNVEGPKENATPEASTWRHWLLLALIIAWTVAMEYIGFLAATAIFTAATAWLLGNRRPVSLVLTTVAGVFMVSIVFDHLLNIPLP